MTPIDKSSVYGPVHASHANIGLAWQALIQQHYGITLPGPMPAWLVQLMLVVFKAQRSARVYHPDNYGDLMTYAGFAEHAQANPGQEYVFPEGSKACEPGYEVPGGGLTAERLARAIEKLDTEPPWNGSLRLDPNAVYGPGELAKFAATDGMSGEFK